MVQSLRRPEIIAIARREGRVTVDRLVEYFGVTPQTIRRDLTDLADTGLLERVHGGAILPSKNTNIAYLERQKLNQPSKVDIARECVRHIPNNCSLFLNIGTTTEAVAAELHRHTNLMVVTNNLNIANNLTNNSGAEVIVTGGDLRKSDGGLVGAMARETVTQFRFDIAVIGCSALHPEGEILDFDMREIGVSQAIIAQSKTVILVADRSKFERTAPLKIAGLNEIHKFITDAAPPAPFIDASKALDLDVIIAPNG